jgi:hypothetical protein
MERLTYTLNDMNHMNEGRMLTISAQSADGRKVEISTNQAGEGLFQFTGTEYRQLMGTMQYSMPTSASNARRQLRQMWEERFAQEN